MPTHTSVNHTRGMLRAIYFRPIPCYSAAIKAGTLKGARGMTRRDEKNNHTCIPRGSERPFLIRADKTALS
jgi:hypothetical protein